jgi:cyclopropane fatty-acyl-phospholipid synthase-like methyltransferase
MAAVGSLPTAERGTAPAVQTCYDLLTVLPACGVTDLTDGKYRDGDSLHLSRASYLAAQERQVEYLLDQAHCGAGTHLLDIGCGYGRILEQAARRGARATGITISPPQVAAGRAHGLDVRELNYRNIFTTATNPPLSPPCKGGESRWKHVFDAVTANGSLEHFVQVSDAAAGHADEIYEEMFEICHRLLVDGGRLVTTAIHFRESHQFDPKQIARGPSAQPRGSDAYHFAMLAQWFGGWYPEPGQLARCAEPHFELIEEEDGTHDYYLTSEYWLARCKKSIAFNPLVWAAIARQLLEHPRAACQMLRLQFWDQSWVWQFRPPAPMRLLRQTWLAK